MTTAKNNQGQSFRNFEDEIERLFNHWHSPLAVHAGAQKFPAVNLEVSPEQYDYYVFAAGLNREKLDVTVDHNLLRLSGEKLSYLPDGKEVTPYRKERSGGEFTRAITLPKDSNTEAIEATYRNGILHLRVQRGGAHNATKISVK